MTGYQPISCDLYDWLEIAARWQLPVTLASRDGRRWDDRVRTIEARDGVEYLLLESGERLSLRNCRGSNWRRYEPNLWGLIP